MVPDTKPTQPAKSDASAPLAYAGDHSTVSNGAAIAVQNARSFARPHGDRVGLT